MKELSNILLEKLKINKETDLSEVPIPFEDWKEYINDNGGYIIRNTKVFWIIVLKKHADEDGLGFPDFVIHVRDEVKDNYWSPNSNDGYGNIIIHFKKHEYKLDKKDLNTDKHGRFLFTRKNADTIIKLLEKIEG